MVTASAVEARAFELKRSRFGAAVAALLLLAGVLWFSLERRIDPRAGQSVHSASAADPGDGAGVGLATSAEFKPNESRKPAGFSFDGITRASELQRLLNTGSVPKGQALEYLFQAAFFCENSAVNRKYKTQRERLGQIPPAELRRLQFNRDYSARFCDVPLPASDEIMRRTSELDAEDDMMRAYALASLEESEAESVGIPLAAELIQTSAVPDALLRAQRFLFSHDQDLPQAKRVALPATIRDPQSRYDAQRTAVEMLACEMRGGCGRNGFYTMYYCSRWCQPGDAMSDIWRRSLTPDQFNYARALAAAIRADQRAGRP